MSFNALHIFDDGHEPSEQEAGATRYALPVSIVGYVEAEGGAAAHAELHALYADAVNALLTEPPLGGIAETIEEGPMRVEVAHLVSTRRLAFELQILVTFPTRRGAPDQLP
jgi:hypothetical protein